jgi:hypothetical protein
MHFGFLLEHQVLLNFSCVHINPIEYQGPILSEFELTATLLSCFLPQLRGSYCVNLKLLLFSKMAITRSKAVRTAEAALNRHPQAVEAFKEGVGSVLRQWTALELAVFHQWGGPTSKQRADDLATEIVEIFAGPDKIYKDDVSLVLEDYLDTQFSTICEDGSPDELGEVFVAMWRQCCIGDFSMVTSTLAKEYVRHEMVSRSQGLEGGDAIDEEDEEDATECMTEMVVKHQVEQLAVQALEGQQGLDMVQAEEQAPVVDPEGWETVTRGSKTKKKGKSYKI